MDSVLSLSEDDAFGILIPQTAWEKGYDDYHLTLVGRFLSPRSVNFEALSGMLVRLMQPARGMVVREVWEEQLCLVFHHLEDLRQVMDLRPWIFDKHLIAVQPLTLRTDPSTVNLEWCPFFHSHS
ncbi:hypothetical protein Salat_1867700 [Sesamum alatum]|uniref:DUF4283 domain-containing protein n=1 Tax=Sesamum alatum TaxID=300844 RepID=A0AAE1Y437_9LAMI|nr:hypothetical protein Salat_1867700 [Sesamum alatum]